MLNSNDLVDKAYVVTGGASGIGEATAIRLAELGAAVCIADLNKPQADKVVEKICQTGGRAIAVATDVTSVEDNEKMVDATLAEFGRVDGAFLNAGIVIGSSVRGGDLEAWKKVIDINLNGVYFGLRAVSAHIQPGGAFVITSSGAGILGAIAMPSYIASKHGVIGLAKAAAAEFAPEGIRVNVLSPGGIDTPMNDLGEDGKKLAAQMCPMRRMGQPEELANTVAFLLSDQSSFMTGQTIAHDGGMTTTLPEGVAFPTGNNSIFENTLLSEDSAS